MKPVRLMFFAFMALSLVSVMPSCKKSDNSEEENQENNQNGGNTPDTSLVEDTTQKYWYVYVGGESFLADTTTITYVYDNALSLHLFQAENADGDVIFLYLTSLEPGTYPIDFDNAINYMSGNLLYSGGFNPQGSITITSNVNNKISGYFNAELFNFDNAASLSLTDGWFGNLPYIE